MTEPSEDEIADALEETGYVYTDPVSDPGWRRITEYIPDEDDPEWPDTWSRQPTERDQAAIDSGAADEARLLGEI